MSNYGTLPIPNDWPWRLERGIVCVVHDTQLNQWYKCFDVRTRTFRFVKEKHLQPFVRRALPLLNLTEGNHVEGLGVRLTHDKYVGYLVVDPVCQWEQDCWDNRFF